MTNITDLMNIHDLIHLVALTVAVAVLKNDIKWLIKTIDTHTASDSMEFRNIRNDIRGIMRDNLDNDGD